MLVGGESKLGSTGDEGIGGSPVDNVCDQTPFGVSAAQPHLINLGSNDDEWPTS